MKLLLTLLCAVFTAGAFANVDNIDISKVTKDKKLVEVFAFIRANQKYYDHWEPEWSHTISKAELVKKLEGFYDGFNGITPKNTELHLLLGDISHFLYNLEAEKFNASALENYEAALAINPKEYRALWFLGNHYAYCGQTGLSAEPFLQAQAMLPADKPADFWEEYAFAMHMANMPTHTLYAIDRYRDIKGEASQFEKQVGAAVQGRIKLLDPNKEYKDGEIWSSDNAGGTFNFTSRPLGLSVAVDSTTSLQVSGYKNKKSSFILYPPKIANKAGIEISYTQLILINAAGKNDKLEDYVNSFADKYKSSKKKIKFGDKYSNAVAYEVRDPDMYSHMGGAHLYLVGIETIGPEYPGLIFEKPAKFPEPGPDQDAVQYYEATEAKDRISDRMFYLFILDTCEDIHDKCLPLFKNFLEEQVVLE